MNVESFTDDELEILSWSLDDHAVKVLASGPRSLTFIVVAQIWRTWTR